MFVALAAGTAWSQQEQRRIERAIRTADPAERKRIDPGLTLVERSELDFGGFTSFTFVYLTDSEDNSRTLLQPEVTLYGRAVIDGAHTFFARARFQYRDFSPGDSFDGRGDRWADPFLDRYWYEFDMRRAAAAYEGRTIAGNINLRVGRQFVDWGAGLTLSENLYAIRPTFEFGRWTLETIAGVTPGDKSVTDFDSSRDDFNDRTWRGFYGGKLGYLTRDNKEFYGFILGQADYNEQGDSNPDLGFPVDFDYNSIYFGVGSNGSLFARLLYTAEFVYELGTSMSDPNQGLPQQEEDINAWAARGQLTYLFADKNNSRAEFECIFASGDSDRDTSSSDTIGGNRPGTKDKAFNSLGFVNTGLALSPSLSNIMTFRVGASTFPFPDAEYAEQLQIGADLFLLNKMNSNGPIDEETNDDRFLGFEADFFINYRVTSDLAFSARYGVFFPGEAIATEKDTRHFVFLGVTLSF